MKEKKRILICPLDWGLGHATRCIQIIDELLLQNHTVIIAASGPPLALLKQEFPNLDFVEFEGYSIRYGKHFLTLRLLLQIPKIVFGIISEHLQLKKICKRLQIDVVISDNRYGCWNPRCHSIFITHQIFIPAPIFKNTIRQINFWFMSRYRQVWIPDWQGDHNLSADLSHGKTIPQNAKYIGPLSRFYNTEKLVKHKIQYKVCAILSGPEPQRSVLEDILIEQICKLQLPAIIIRGLPENSNIRKNFECIEFVNHLPKDALLKVMLSAENIICRSGYSSIMDLQLLEQKAILIPTPGQKEQEYLAANLSARKICFSSNQHSFELAEALKKNLLYNGFKAMQQTRLSLAF